MSFQIAINYYKKTIRLSVEQIFLDDRTERYRVIGANGTIEVESNRPFFRSKNLKHRSEWKQIEGKRVSDHVVSLIAVAIIKYGESMA